MVVVVAYWKIRGLGAPLRMMCEYAGVEYTSKCYEVRCEDGTFDWSQWFDVKKHLATQNAFMNLPHIIDGGGLDNASTVVAQFIACASYLGRKFGLFGLTSAETCKVEQVLCETHDLRNTAAAFFYSPASSNNDKRKAHFKSLKNSYIKFEAWLLQHGTLYTASSTPTVGDFHLWEMLDQYEMLAFDSGIDSPLASYPKLKAFYGAIRSEPKLQKYFASELYKYPVNNPYAGWIGSPSPLAPASKL